MSYTLRQNPANGGNYSPDRSAYGGRINKIVIHHAATTDFDGIGATFRALGRYASAHYGVGRNNNVDQYVAEKDVAWHAGNWAANISSIGIENVNASGAPDWAVADSTFNTLVELVRDIAKRNGLLPLRVGISLFGHKDFSATACPGQLYGRLQELADKVNNGSSTGAPVPSQPVGKKSNEQIANEVIAGGWGNGPDRQARLAQAGYDYNTIQAIVNQKLGGGSAPAAPARRSNDTIANEVLAGSWGNGPDRQARLQAAGYDYNAIQALVNQKLGISTAPNRKSNDTIANEVIAGLWGNGPDRQSRLVSAGYDYNTIQAIVNRKLS